MKRLVLLAVLASSVALASGTPLDEIRFTRWSKAILAGLERRPYYLTREELLGLPLAPPPANSDASTRADLDEMLRLQGARTPAQQRAILQHLSYAGVCGAFFDRLHRTPASAPKTRALLEHVEHDAMIAVFNAKRRFNRARPHQLEPRLKPSIGVPGHAAYPSGHALQGRLVALTLAAVSPDDREALAAIGAQIGHEREIAGLHYAADSAASRALGDALFARLEKNPKFLVELEAARVEWRPTARR